MAAVGNPILASALECAAFGWKLIPVYGVRHGGGCTCRKGKDCPSPGKHPIPKGWQDLATDDEDQLTAWFEQWPDANLGLRMGPQSGVVDIEFDGEEGRAFADEHLKECYTPTYTSHRSTHRLFKWSDELASLGKTIPKIHGLECRLGQTDKGAQSVLPPSIHAKGGKYTWVQGLDPSQADLADVPQNILTLLINACGESVGPEKERPRSPRMKLYEQEHIVETVDGRDDVIYREACALWGMTAKAFGSGVFDDHEQQARVYTQIWAWNKAKCIPPLDEDTLKVKVDGAREFIRRSNVDQATATGQRLTALGLEYRDEEWWPGQWRVEVVLSDPPEARLYLPALDKPVEMSLEDFDNPSRVHLAVLTRSEGKVVLADRPRQWPAIWNGVSTKTKSCVGLKAKLLRGAERLEAPHEKTAQATIAEFIAGHLSRTRTVGDGETRPHMEQPFRDSEGVYWFRFSWLLKQAKFESFDATRNAFSKLLRDAGVTDQQLHIGDQRTRWMAVDAKAWKALNDLQAGRDSRTPL